MKLIASDFDGTLFRGGVVSDRDRTAIAGWRAAGNLFGIVTGRGGELPAYVTGELELALDFVVCGSGSMIFDGKPALLEALTTPDMVAELLEDEARAHNAEGWGRCRCDADINGFCQFSTRMKDDGAAAGYAAVVNEKYPQVSAFQNGRCVDVVRRGVSKATGISRVAELLGYKRVLLFGDSSGSEDPGAIYVTAVGDSYNDLPMIEAFDGYAIAGSAIARRAERTCVDIAELCEALG